jgi:DNA-binding MarR family transcriptional regulator
LFALGSRGQGRDPGYGLVRLGIDTKDARKHKAFLTAKGKTLLREIVRLARLDHDGAAKLRSRDQILEKERALDIARDQWLSRLTAAGRKLNSDDMKLAVHLNERLMRHQRMQRVSYEANRSTSR